ncbi:MAG TPA: hypothetical protein DD379_19715 [Cyanobacteria bacterium UBA11162]|nr:hypothetical protein [Cyanobacteria bacterium UBA11162]
MPSSVIKAYLRWAKIYHIALRLFGWIGWINIKIAAIKRGFTPYCQLIIAKKPKPISTYQKALKSAARVGDPVAHTSPPILTGSAGSPDVWIGGKPAWRGLIDKHICTTPQPPHGVGIVIDGSSTVEINGLPACRMGDTIQEVNSPPNKIIEGCSSVEIGD